MMASIFEFVIHIMVNLMVVKMVFFRAETQQNKKDNGNWKLAVDSMSIMETRLQQVQERDIKQQENIWSLEDQNRDLQQRVTRLTKELLLAQQAHSEQIPADLPPGHDDDHDDDRHDSIPTN